MVLLVVIGTACPAHAADASAIQTIRIGVFEYPGYCYKDSEGHWSGADVEQTENIAQKAGVLVEMVPYTDATPMLADLDAGRIDIASNFTKTSDREARYLFSESPQGTSSASLICRSDDNRYEYGDVQAIPSMKIGVAASSSTTSRFNDWCAAQGITPSTIEYPGVDSLYAPLDSGEVDAILLGASYQEGYRTLLTFSPAPYYYLYRKDETALKIRMDTAMEQILALNPQYQAGLMEKYGLTGLTDYATFTQSEKDWVKTHQTATVAVLSDDQPFYAKARDGSDTGILPALYKEVGTKTGMTFTFTAYDTGEAAIAAVKAGKADILGIYGNGIPSAYAAGLALTQDFTTQSIIMVTRAGTSTSKVRTAGLTSRNQTLVENALGSEFKLSYQSFDTVPKAFRALQVGNVDSVICGLPAANWFINQTNASSYTLTAITSRTISFCSAVAYGNTTLQGILDKGIYASGQDVDGIIATSIQADASNPWAVLSRIPTSMLTGVLAVMTAMVILLVYLLISLRRRQKERLAIMDQMARSQEEAIRAEEMTRTAEERSQFFSNISHDMRTPLNAIIGFSSLASREADTPALKDYLDKIQSSGNLLGALIDDTLTISRVNSNKLTLHLEPVDSQALFSAFLDPIRQAADEKHITFTVDTSRTRPRTILADRLGIQKIFLNILTNAVKYTPEGGHIHVDLYNDPEDGDEPDSLFVVQDDGIGIDPEFMPHLYEPFSQEKRHGYESVGTGLGLSIVKELVDLMGGTIDVASVKNAGTTFTVRLHFDPAPEEGAQAPVPTSPDADFSGRKVLLCEDNALNRQIAVALLKHKGLSVVTAENGQTGVEAFSHSGPGEFSAVLMDLRMPVMDGFDATQAIRGLDRPDAGIPILAMTADAFDDDVRRCQEAGMDGHIPKPVDPQLLYRELARVMEPAAS